MIVRKYYLIELRNDWVILNQLVQNIKGEVSHAYYCVFNISDIDSSYLKYVITYCTRSKRGLYPAIAVPDNAFYAIDFCDINEYIVKERERRVSSDNN